MLFKCWFSIFKAQTVKPLQSWVPLWAQEWFLQLTGDPETSQEFHQTPKPSYCLQGSKSLNEYSSYRPKNQVPKAPNVTTRATSLPWTCLLSSSACWALVSWQTTRQATRNLTLQSTLEMRSCFGNNGTELFPINTTSILISNNFADSPPSSQFSNIMHRNQSGAFPNGQIINYSIHFPHKNNNSFM